jgi:hypothetical protein
MSGTVLDLIARALRADVKSDTVRRRGADFIKLVLATLATYSDASTAETFVSAATIAAEIGCSER